MDTIINLLQYALLGLFQGLTEPIPVSSSGHLVIAEHLIGLHIEGLSFEVFVNFASLLAVVLIYRKDLVRIADHGLGYIRTGNKALKPDFMFILYIIIGTIPVVVLGLLFNDLISDYLKGVKITGITLLITGCALWLIRNLRGRKQDKDLTLRDAVIVGLSQAVALLPGISRSGATVVAAMALGMRQDTALRFSFFLYIPVSLGGMILEGRTMIKDPNMNELLIPYLVAFICALVATYFSLKWFIGIMAKGNLKWFAIYCWIVGCAVLLFL